MNFLEVKNNVIIDQNQYLFFKVTNDYIKFTPAGLSFTGKNGMKKIDRIKQLSNTEYKVIFRKEPDNKYDKWAIHMYISDKDKNEFVDIGYVPRKPLINKKQFNEYIYNHLDELDATLLLLNDMVIVKLENKNISEVEFNDFDLFI